MDSLRTPILQHLATLSEPIGTAELADAVATRADAAEVRGVLRGLVESGKVQRHHNPDGILRYSLVGSNNHAATSTADTTKTTRQVTVRGKSADFLRLLSSTPQTSAELQQRSGLSGKEVSNLLTQLKAKGVVAGANGTGKQGAWTRATDVVVTLEESHAVRPSTKQTPMPPPATKARPLSERKRDFMAAAEQSENVLKALEFNRDTARDALELYVASAVDPAIYAGLKSAMEAAQTALDAFVAGGHA